MTNCPYPMALWKKISESELECIHTNDLISELNENMKLSEFLDICNINYLNEYIDLIKTGEYREIKLLENKVILGKIC